MQKEEIQISEDIIFNNHAWIVEIIPFLKYTYPCRWRRVRYDINPMPVSRAFSSISKYGV